ncbi:hypothetical protein LCGC14_0920960 [marine sediment metagenome]|uniref:Uncharacterized protein n=1 Tax=marine sediment metagenome TaxID=412755 RepID=A0A0F9PBI1_9ZZZZ
MTRLGVSESAQYFEAGTTAHIEKEPNAFEGLCGQKLSYCRPEQEVIGENAKYHMTQKMCKRCMKRRDEGS